LSSAPIVGRLGREVPSYSPPNLRESRIRHFMPLQQLISVLQIAIGPVILISGVGLLLLAMTNRLGRTIDRVRQLVDLRRHGNDEERRRCNSQLTVLWRRARLLRNAISLAAIGALIACLLIIVLFVGELLKLEISLAIILLFVACMAAVIGSLLCFIRDINLSLRALALELEIGDGRDG
jgi:hypothetical protein